MKNVAAALICLILIFSCSLSFSAEQKVLVLDFKDMTGELGGSIIQMGTVIKEEVQASEGYSYISQDELFKKWFGDTRGDAETEAQHIALGVLGHTTYAMSEIYEKQKTVRVGFMIISGVERGGGVFVVHSMIINMDNSRYCKVSDSCVRSGMKDVLKKQVAHLLNSGKELCKVAADKEVDAMSSTVAYEVMTEKGEDIEIRITYNGIRMAPQIEDARIVLSGMSRPEVRSYKLRTREKRVIEFTGNLNSGRLDNLTATAEAPGGVPGSATQEALSVISRGGYVLNFTLFWKGGALKAVKVEPLVNPYGAVK